MTLPSAPTYQASAVRVERSEIGICSKPLLGGASEALNIVELGQLFVESLCSCSLARIVACQQANDDVGVNGAHVAWSLRFADLPITTVMGGSQNLTSPPKARSVSMIGQPDRAREWRVVGVP